MAVSIQSLPAPITPTERFEKLLVASSGEHGHLCAGQVVGVRMALLGLKLIGIPVPVSHRDIKKLIVFVEMDRCAGDAVAHVSGVKLGRRSLKFRDYGIMAATFVNLETHQAIRVLSTEESRDLADLYAPDETDPRARQLAGYKVMPDEVMFRAQRVEVDLTEYDLPGPTRLKTVCEECGQVIRDNRHTVHQGRVLCGLCAPGSYILSSDDIDLSDPAAASGKPGKVLSLPVEPRPLNVIPLAKLGLGR